jgi:hypothetical protein
MRLDEYKKHYQNIRMDKMNSFIANNNITDFDGLLNQIKKQDKKDEKYVLHNKMIPLLFAIVILIPIMIFIPEDNPLIIIGTLLMVISSLVSLVMVLFELKQSKIETIGLNTVSYIEQKIANLKKWKSTQPKYQLMILVYVSGLLLYNVGLHTYNNSRIFSHGQFFLYMFIIVLVFTIAWFVGEYFYRRRFNRQHEPLIQILSDIKEDLKNEE